MADRGDSKKESRAKDICADGGDESGSEAESEVEGQNDEGVYAPGVRELLTQAEEALDAGDEQTAGERIDQAREALINSRADDLDMTPALQEALEAAVNDEEFAENIPLASDDIPEEWETDEVDRVDIPAQVARDLREIDTPIRLTIEPVDRSCEEWRIRGENLPFGKQE